MNKYLDVNDSKMVGEYPALAKDAGLDSAKNSPSLISDVRFNKET